MSFDKQTLKHLLTDLDKPASRSDPPHPLR
jgi:hypothetical protein